MMLTPDVHPELFQTRPAETIKTDDERSRSRERCTGNDAIDSRKAADIQ